MTPCPRTPQANQKERLGIETKSSGAILAEAHWDHWVMCLAGLEQVQHAIAQSDGLAARHSPRDVVFGHLTQALSASAPKSESTLFALELLWWPLCLDTGEVPSAHIRPRNSLHVQYRHLVVLSIFWARCFGWHCLEPKGTIGIFQGGQTEKTRKHVSILRTRSGLLQHKLVHLPVPLAHDWNLAPNSKNAVCLF